jgi:hypothetical protein
MLEDWIGLIMLLKENKMTDEKLNEDLRNFRKELERLINRYSLERMCNTPDFILATYLTNCLSQFAIAYNDCTQWRIK